jgi:hypothetical protein
MEGSGRALMKVMFRHLPGGSEEFHKEPQSG